MLSAEQVKGLKQSNVSKDTEKTKARIKADFKAATNAMKQAIVEQSGLKRGTIYKVYERGTAGAQIVLALAEVLKVSPYYYTGELDDRAPLKDADILNFLDSRGYTALSEELKAGASEEVTTKQKRKYTRKPKPEPTEKPAPEEPNEKAPPSAAEIAESNEQLAPEAETVLDTMDVKITLPENPGIHETVETLTEEETVMLLKALFIKEKAGGAPAEMLKIIKRCLLV